MSGTSAASPQKCPRPNCFAPDTLCVLGNVDRCPEFERKQPEAAAAETRVPGIPWSGLAMGSGDLPAIAALGHLRVVALVGLHNAGKTTALAASILARRRGSTANGRFAGSYTLLGWQQIARHLQWRPFGKGFPPHTTSADQRVPALLHTAISTDDRQLLHVLYSDAPGEWFRDWALDADAVEGASWLAGHADSFVLFADSEALAGPKRGESRGTYEALARRLASLAEERPVLCVRAKADVEVAEPLVQFVDDLNERLFGVETIRVSIKEGAAAPITDPVDLGTAAAVAARLAPLTKGVPPEDPLLGYRTAVLA